MADQLHAQIVPGVKALVLYQEVHRLAEALLETEPEVLGRAARVGRRGAAGRAGTRGRVGHAVDAVLTVHRVHLHRLRRRTRVFGF